MRKAFGYLVPLLCVAFSAAALYNVMGDAYEVERLADAAACGDQGASCSARKTRFERTPFAQTFEIVTPKRTVDVKCTRAYIMVGDYACVVR